MNCIAEQLIAARKSGIPCAPIREALQEQSLAAAYEIQDILHERRACNGARCIGYKVGLSSNVAMEKFGVSEPAYGRLYDDMELMCGSELEWKRAIQPILEGEIAFVLGADLEHLQITTPEVLSAVDYALPAIEIAGPAVEANKMSALDIVADNAIGSYFVLGHSPKLLSDVDLISCEMMMEINGEERTRGFGRSNYGSPINTLCWLARKLARIGQPLQAGDIVMSGSLGAMIPARAGDHVVVTIEGFGEVSISFSSED